jgi:serine O-acetyltransferase
MFSNIQEHWQDHNRDFTRRGFWALVIYRYGRWRYCIRPRLLRVPFSFLYKVLKLLSEMLCGIELPCEVVIGRHFLVEHCGAIVISGDAVFGDHCIIRQGVTVGLRYTGQRGSPVIGDRCDIGAGAKLLGDIRIGNDVAIGANAVVLTDVPNGCTAVGVPARIKPRGGLRTPERALVEKI